MSSRVADAEVETFSADWRAPWRGPRRFAMLTSCLGDPDRFVAYGTDGYIAFAVEGLWRTDLPCFLARVEFDGVELLPPPYLSVGVSRDHHTFPDPHTVQRYLDARLGSAAAA